MNDSQIIYDFIELSIPDEHPAIYQYVMGGDRSKMTAINNIYKVTSVITPPFSQGHVRTIIRRFLKNKKEQYQRGEINIKPIY